jgi:TolA-binding protein
VLWLRAGKLDLATNAIQDLAQQFPNNAQIPDLLLKAADGFRQQKKFEAVISICEQLKARYPKSVEALAGSYLLGLIHRDQKEP